MGFPDPKWKYLSFLARSFLPTPVIIAGLGIIVTLLSSSLWSHAQVTTTITGSGLNTSIEHTVNSTTWNIRGGTPSAGETNLFHSFGDLSVGAGHTAAFQNVQADGTTPVVTNASGVNNIIGRVTGGNPSNLYGTINSQTGFPNANLFLINPAGIVFGPGAALNVGGSAHFSTADYVRLGTGNEFFFADLSKNSTLTSAPVTAFGFLGNNPAATQAITVQGNLSLTGANSLSLVGRDVTNGTTTTPGITIDGAHISNPGGSINLVSVGTPINATAGGEVSAMDVNPASASSGHGFATLGSVVMTNNAFLSVSDPSGPAAGQIVIRGGQLTMEGGSQLLARTTDANSVQGGNIDISVTGAMILSGRSSIDSQVVGSAAIPGSDILIQAGSLTITEGSQITTTNESGSALSLGGSIDITADTILLSGAIDGGGNTVQSGLFAGTTRTSAGAGGQIRVTATDLSVLDGATINTSTLSSANAGDIEITATRVLVSGVNTTNGITSPSSTISSRATWDRQADSPSLEQQNTGNGGNIRIVTTSLDIQDGGQLNVSTETVGNAGTIDVAADNIEIAGTSGAIRSGISAKSEQGGDGGTISLTTPALSLTQGGAIELGTTGDGSGGQLVVNADQISITNGGIISSTSGANGMAGNLSLSAQTFTMSDAGSELSIRTTGPGNSGTITLNAENVLLGSGSTIDSRTSSSFTRADPTMQAAGGNITVSVGHNFLLQGGRITASSSGLAANLLSVGDAGAIGISAGQVQLTNDAEISSSTILSNGTGGTISVAGTGPTGSIQLSGGSITAATTGNGDAGTINVSGNTVTVSGAASSIDTSTTGAGNAGNIQLQAGQVTLENGGTISSASVDPATGNAGSVTINTSGQFQNSGGTVTTSADNGQGGNITIRSDEILLNNSATIAASTTGSMNAGDIVLVAGDRIMLQDSTVTTSASQGSGGNITLLAPNLVRLRNGQIISSVQGGTGTSGGDITIDPQAVLLQGNSQILAQAFLGNGGNISLTAGVLIVEPGSLIDATSQLGISGQVTLQAPIQSLAGVVKPLPLSFVIDANLLGQRCAAHKGGQFSSLVQGTRDALPPQPGDYMSSPLADDSLTASPHLSDASVDLEWQAIRLGLAGTSAQDENTHITISGCRS